jgi:hypothetical protein
MSRLLGTAKAAQWTGCSERSIRDMCKKGKVEGARQFARDSMWLIPVETLERICECPEELRETAYGSDA